MTDNTYRDYISLRESEINEKDSKDMERLAEAQKYSDDKYDAKERREKLAEAYSDFRCFVKDTLLSEAIKSIYIPAINVNENSITNFNLANTMVKNFITENDSSDMIFLRNKSNTLFIESLKNSIDKYSAIVLESVDPKDPDTFKINKGTVKDFVEDLSKEDDYEEIKDSIRTRVINAEEEFIANAMADKQSMDQIITQTATKIDSINSDENIEQAAKDAITNEASMDAKEAMYNVRNRIGKSVFECMVEKMSNSIYANKTLRESFSTDTGKIDMDMVLESTRCMYGFLETLQTTKLIKVDEAYIKNALDAM